MKKPCFSLLLLILVVATTTSMLPAQDANNNDEQVCVVVVEGQNQKRTVAGAVNTECEDRTPVQWHDPPFGNWGVSSNYGSVTDTDQFRGWSHEDGPPTKRQWNSCTTERPKFAPPNPEFYNAPDEQGNPNMTQARSDVVTHGRMLYRYVLTYCLPTYPGGDPPPSETQTNGCGVAEGLVVREEPDNYMSLYELDSPSGTQLVETLYFPATSLTLNSCTSGGCPEKTSSWLPMTSSTSPTAHVEAELRMKVSATLEISTCEWDWN